MLLFHLELDNHLQYDETILDNNPLCNYSVGHHPELNDPPPLAGKFLFFYVYHSLLSESISCCYPQIGASLF
jgi:hypothetical protein